MYKAGMIMDDGIEFTDKCLLYWNHLLPRRWKSLLVDKWLCVGTNGLTSSARLLSLLAQSSACSSTVDSSVAGPCLRASAAETICCRWRTRMCLSERSRGVAHCQWSREGSSSLKRFKEHRSTWPSLICCEWDSVWSFNVLYILMCWNNMVNLVTSLTGCFPKKPWL